jgi:diguanylate cyclase (GGDEF)-like protein
VYTIGEVAIVLALQAAVIALVAGVWLFRRRVRDRLRTALRKPAPPESTDRIESLVENIADGFLVFDSDWNLSYANHEAARLLGGTIHSMVTGAAGPDGVTEGAQYRQLRVTVQEHDPADPAAPSLLLDRWIELRGYPSADGWSVYLHDATERKRLEERIRTSSLLDELTGLYNRRGFLTLAEQHLKLAERTGRSVLLIFADLDDFKAVNDTHGHPEGDRALVEVARTLRQVFRDSDIIARIGGDEFVILALETSDTSGDLLSRRLRERLAARSRETDRGYELAVSLGIARWDARSPSTIADLLARADSLMYEHKRQKTIRHIARA